MPAGRGGDHHGYGAAAMGGGVPEFAGVPVDVTLRVLCPEEKVGAVIGKGGGHVRALLQETGSTVRVGERVDECDERVVHISCQEVMNASAFGSEEALLRVVCRLLEDTGSRGREERERDRDLERDGGPRRLLPEGVRLLVPQGSAGCLLGKGGSIISSMRRASGANIRILPTGSLPKCADRDDELVQVTGDMYGVCSALRLVCAQLRNNMVSPGPHGQGDLSRGSQGPRLPPVSAGGAYPPPRVAAPAYPRLTHTVSGSSAHELGRIASPGSSGRTLAGPYSYDSPRDTVPREAVSPVQVHHWQPSANPIPIAVPPTETLAGVSTVLLSVPAAISGAVIGKGGANIAQIRSISGAKVHLHEIVEGDSERIVEVSGTADQVQAAQALVQAFVIKGSAQAAAAGGAGAAY